MHKYQNILNEIANEIVCRIAICCLLELKSHVKSLNFFTQTSIEPSLFSL